MALPFRVEPVNCWVLRDPDGSVVIVDTGMALDADGAWRSALEAIDVRPDDVRSIVVTHFHPDHIGGAQAISALTGAPVLASPITIEQTPPMWGAGLAGALDRIDDHIRRHGAPAELLAKLEWERDGARMAVALPDSFTPLAPGTVIEAGGAHWDVHATPGHADGHISLHDPSTGMLLAGDHLLERISPAVGLWPDHSRNPLRDYIASLGDIGALSLTTVLPGHGAPFRTAADRCAALVRHHRDRAQACIAALMNGAATAHEVATIVFPGQTDPASQRFALTETAAHLEWLRLGSAAADDPEPIVVDLLEGSTVDRQLSDAGVFEYFLSH